MPQEEILELSQDFGQCPDRTVTACRIHYRVSMDRRANLHNSDGRGSGQDLGFVFHCWRDFFWFTTQKHIDGEDPFPLISKEVYD
jgi:hypothetical protein